MQMRNIVIVDDEPWVRDGIAELIDWRGNGVIITGLYADGPSALEGIRKCREVPEILLTDIRLPGMSGLELIDRVRSDYPAVVSVILTGYEEFEYAKRAVHLNVFEYLVKPVGKEVLLATITRILGILSTKEGEGSARGDETDDSNESLIVKKAKYVIASRVLDDLSLPGVAELTGISPAYLSSLFHRVTGEPFRAYVARAKIEAATRIITREPHLKVYELCERVRYHDPDHFTQLFRRYTGMTPIEYKRNRDERG